MSTILKLLEKRAAGGPPGGQFPQAGGFDTQAPGGDVSGETGDPEMPVIHSHGGTALVLTPYQIEQMHQALTQNGAEPHGLMVILPKDGTQRAVHFQPIPVSALQTPDAAMQLLDQWEQAHAQGGGGGGGHEDPGSDDEADYASGAKAPPSGAPPHHPPPPHPAGPPNPGAPGGFVPKQAGFMVAMLQDHLTGEEHEKTAQVNTIHGTGLGIAAGIEALLKGANHMNFEDMLEALTRIDRLDKPESVRSMRPAASVR